jgi:hypothetical protein
MKFYVEVDMKAAIVAGKLDSGWSPVEITEGDLAVMPLTDRAALVEMAQPQANGDVWLVPHRDRTGATSPVPPVLTEASYASVQALVAWRIAYTSWVAAEDRANIERRAAAEAAAVMAIRARVRRLLDGPVGDVADLMAAGELLDSTEIRLAVAGEPFELAWRARLSDAEATVKARKAAASQRNAEIEAAKVAAAEAQRLALATWINTHGTASQRGRLAAGLLPQREAQTTVRARLFASLDGQDRYADIEDGDVCAACDDDGRAITYTSDTEAELTDAQWVTFNKIKAAAPEGAVVTPRWHQGECSCGQIATRYSAHVGLTWHGYRFAREYWLPAEED